MKSYLRYKIDDDLIPYACHANDNTVVTKNGMVLQTVTFNSAIDDQISFRKQIRDFISSHYNKNVAIYFHTIKISDERDIVSLDVDDRVEDGILSRISEICKFTARNEISFNVTFVTRILDKDGSDMLFTFAKNAYYKRNDVFIQKAVKRLTKITDDLVKDFKDFNPILLGIYKKDDQYFSHYMNFLGKIINFEDVDFTLPLGSLCYSTNYSTHKFGKNKFMIRSDTARKYGKTFSIKEYTEISCDIIYRMLEGVPNIIVAQVVMPIENSVLVKEYSGIAEIYQASNDEEFKSSAALKYMTDLLSSNGSNDVYAKSQTNITIFANTQEKLDQVAKMVGDIFAKIGIVAFAEDVNLQNAFFSIIPGNFRFLARLANLPIDLMAGFAYAQGSDKNKNTSYMWGKILFTLQKINNRRFEFGMPIEQRNLFITGVQGSGRGLLANIVMLGCIKNEIDVLYIDTQHRSDAVSILAGLDIVGVGVENYWIDSEKINPFASITKADIKYVENIIKLMIGSQKEAIPSNLISLIAAEIIKRDGVDFHDVIKSCKASEYLRDFVEIGKYGKVFDYQGKDDVLSIGKSARVVIEEDVLSSAKILSAVNFALFFKILKILQKGRKFTIIINNVFDIFKTSIDAKMLEQIFTIAKERNLVSFVFTFECDINKISNSKIKDVIFKYCEHKIHFANDRVSGINGYQECFNLSGKDMDLIETVERSYGRGFVMFTPYIRECVKFNLSELGHDLRIISDGSGMAMDILQSDIINIGITDRRKMYTLLRLNIEEYIDKYDTENNDQDDEYQDVLAA
ncbi:VirB4 family type IV secretion/conjugal transfer ATPase [Candidatus Deianiraea vastatrix]|uniref:Type IV secretion system protein VirB4 n=1 Tax=Candidatus Deianiraea vastatrix TaxID=2163644 RepID=A0A5B8XDZ1_9RICK|nr:VirB4 family type IV secretion system protein [Candidatus Deianiraea vastatrix]QED23085.1 Type IV secretion system protein VirB4 [Candidatus Deianiraea vastatrix]